MNKIILLFSCLLSMAIFVSDLFTVSTKRVNGEYISWRLAVSTILEGITTLLLIIVGASV